MGRSGEEMSSQLRWFAGGAATALATLAVAAYLFLRAGGVSMETTAQPLPFEKTIARIALRASMGSAANQKNPLAFDEPNMVAGANIFKKDCTVCHGLPGESPSAIPKGMFPPPPQLFEPHDMVVRDPEGVTHWKVTYGIRLSGMPGFESTLSDTERWQVTMLVARADKLPPAVQAAFVQ